MSYKYWLPDEQGKKTEYITESNAVIIVGANGSGKSKLGAWIEQQSFKEVHRVGAQRNLNFNENIPLKSYSEAENWVFYGNEKEDNHQKGHRWNWGHYTTKLIDDFDNVLSALIALKNNEISQFHEACKKAGDNKNEWPDIPTTAIDKLKTIWSSVLPQRQLIEDDSKFYAIFHKNGEKVRYSATEMSDGERAVLYLASQVLCVPENKILIIDEPEIHLHRSIINRLWRTLESCRPDCLFIYITHDLHFVSAHGHVDKYWIKNYDGTNWTFEKIVEEELPEELTIEILGSRKNVLFVEGEKGSYDYLLYDQLYPNYLIIPCGGCSQVISRTKAFRNSKLLHNCEVYGLIDRDYRSDHEINAYISDNIYVLAVAEVENLFLVEELICLMAKQFGEDPNKIVEKVKNFVINTKFANMINRQICQSVVAEIKYKLSCIEINKQNEADAKTSLQTGIASIDYDTIKQLKENIFQNALANNDYREVLKIFNEKGIAAEIGSILGIDRREYQKKVICLLQGPQHDAIIRSLEAYLPVEIPR